MEKRIKELCEMFCGLPNGKPIVRNNQPNDAFCVYVYETLFRNLHRISEFNINNLDMISHCVVPPPDNGIDIFIEHVDGDELFYHIVQVKNTELAEHEIRNCFA